MRIQTASSSLLIALGAAVAAAQEPAARAPLDITLVDAPYNVSFGGRAPSMRQSLDLTVGAHELAHGAIERAFGRRRRLGRWTTVLFDLVTTSIVALPLSDVWLHEEFHRAQMGRRGVGSVDDVYRFDVGAEVIAVSHVRDEDIVALKARHPSEW